MNKIGRVEGFAHCRHSFPISDFPFSNSVARLLRTAELLRICASVPTDFITARIVAVHVHNG